MAASIANSRRIATLQAVAGGGLLALFWWIAWSQETVLRFHTFFPLWLGYILVADAASLGLRSSSLLHRLGRRSILLFLYSIPFWWAFELLNRPLDNWLYRLPHEYSWLRYHIEASMAFSTVVPAVFVTAELMRSLWRGRIAWIRLDPDHRVRGAIGLSGAFAIVLALAWPNPFFPLLWIGTFFAADWFAYRSGARSISGQVRTGNWTTVVTLFVATLWCGFLWEMWNSRSTPSWTYELPYAEWFRVFEMPVLGYGGYLPFGICLYAAVMALDRLIGNRVAPAVKFDHD